ncbi:MAG: hypothetical protein ACOYYF_11655 [Chloroflexota bacterium]|nr:hypothetical protein [Chloroflexota bacterium]MBI5702383.1 hypothetical protein [Chloroflexota bacterium]
MTNQIEIGRLLRAATTGFVAGCRVNQLDAPSFGALVRAPLGGGYQIFGIIHDIHIDDDGLVRQLVTAENVSQAVMNDNRVNRIVPVEMSVLAVGYEQNGRIFHLLPPRPPLSLDVIYLCDEKDTARFTERLGYLRHIVNSKDVPIGEVIAAHLLQASSARGAESNKWKEAATHEVIMLLRDDYPTLMSVLGALSDVSV